MEEAITGDYSLIKAWKADKMGNVIFRYGPIKQLRFFYTFTRLKYVITVIFVHIDSFFKFKHL